MVTAWPMAGADCSGAATAISISPMVSLPRRSAAAVLGLRDAGEVVEKFDQFQGHRQGLAQADAAGGGGQVGEVFLDLEQFLFADAFDILRSDLSSMPALSDSTVVTPPSRQSRAAVFGTERWNFQHFQDTGRDLGEEVIEFGDFAGAEILAECSRQRICRCRARISSSLPSVSFSTACGSSSSDAGNFARRRGS